MAQRGRWPITELVRTILAMFTFLAMVAGGVWSLGRTNERVETNARDIEINRVEIGDTGEKTQALSVEMATLSEQIRSLNVTICEIKPILTDLQRRQTN